MRVLAYTVAALLVAASTTAAVAVPPGQLSPLPTHCTPGPWTHVGTDTFTLPLGYTRSQGITSDGQGWLFSYQAGLTRTDDAYTPLRANTIAPDIAVNQPAVDPLTGQNNVGGNHIGDIDVRGGLLYAPIEEGGFNVGVGTLNNPAHQNSFIALYDAKTLAYTGKKYLLPHDLQTDGVPWVAADPSSGDLYTDEWNNPHDRLNVYDSELKFQRFLNLSYGPELGVGFRLSRIQGAKISDHTMYASRDDDAKTVFSIDLLTGQVKKLFSLDPGVPAESEGIAIRATPDGALLHVLIILDNALDTSLNAKNIRVALEHFAPPRPC